MPSGVKQVSGLPENWSNDWIKWSVSRVSERASEEDLSELPYISNEAIASWTGKLLNEPKPEEAVDARRFVAGDVLFNKLRPYLAKVYHAQVDGVSSGELLCLRPGEGVSSRYLFYYLSSYQLIERVNAATFGAKMPRADWDIVGHQPLPMPGKDQQERIADFLDKKTARIDALIARKERLLKLLAEKRQALITRAVTKGLDPTALMKPSGIDWLGDIPTHWTKIPLNRVTAKITNGYVGPTRDILTDSGVRYIQSLHIKNNRIEFRDDFFVEPVWSEAHSKSILCEDDVLIVQTGAIGEVARVSQEFAGCNCHALIICTPEKGKLSGQFLSWILRSDYGQEFLNAVKTGALHPHLNCGNVKFFRVVLPSLDEQEQIAEFVTDHVGQIDKVAAKVSASILRLREYRAAVITASVTGGMEVSNG